MNISNKLKFFSIGITLFSGCVLGIVPINAEKKQPDNKQRGSQYLAYPVPDYGIPELSATPDGYVPFHMEHYGRHGSRWRLSAKDYDTTFSMLKRAFDAGKLTPDGIALYEQVKILKEDSKGRLGELTPLGHRQHRGIARRMAANFPEIFSDSTYLDAKSTVVIRCILSMANEVAEFEKMFPGMKTQMDASRTTQSILAYNSNDTVAKKLSNDAYVYVDEFAKTLPKPEAFYHRIFNDRQFVKDSVGDKIFKRVFDLAVNMQSHDDYPTLFDYFTEEELHNEWLYKNADWYITAGNTPLTKNRVPYNQRVLLRNIIESADTAMFSPKISANLRFGHESIVLPLTILLELNNTAYETEDLSTLADHWRNYEIFPMGSNIQMVFYRPVNKQNYKEEDILVKVLLNEAEATLPTVPVSGNYYRWSDLRSHYMNKLDNFSSRFPE